MASTIATAKFRGREDRGMDHSDWNTAALVFVALLNLYTAYIARKTEKNTNSMKDALVDSTAKENFAAGLKKGEDSKK
jgi:hypothetical protein